MSESRLDGSLSDCIERLQAVEDLGHPPGSGSFCNGVSETLLGFVLQPYEPVLRHPPRA